MTVGAVEELETANRCATDRVAGSARLRLEQRGGRTEATSSFSRGILQLSAPERDRSGVPTFHLLNPGGGVLAGDTTELSVELGVETNPRLHNIGAPKVYRSQGASIAASTRIRVAEGATFRYLREPVILYCDKAFREETQIDVDPEGPVVMGEIIGPGWDPTGGAFSFDSWHSATDVRVGGRTMVADRLRIRHRESAEWGTGVGEERTPLMGANYLGSLVVAGSARALRRADERMLSCFAELPEGSSTEIQWSQVESVLFVRSRSSTSTALTECFEGVSTSCAMKSS